LVAVIGRLNGFDYRRNAANRVRKV
jgi:hypothetical protein